MVKAEETSKDVKKNAKAYKIIIKDKTFPEGRSYLLFYWRYLRF